MIIIMLVLTLLLNADIHKSKIYEDKAQSGLTEQRLYCLLLQCLASVL